MLRFFCLLALLVTAGRPGATQPKPSEVLLVGTFHFHNPGADVAKYKTLDILGAPAQAELQRLAASIARFRPARIFVEWPWQDQAQLDSAYQAYLGPSYERYVRTRYPKRLNFFLKNEIVQLAFRTGKQAGVRRVWALDYDQTNFPFDSVRQSMQQAQQQVLLQRLAAAIKANETDFNQKQATLSLSALLLDMNTPVSLDANKQLYLDLLNRAGRPDQFVGAYLVSEWCRRNLYMYSLVQKRLASGERAMILVGAGHAAMLREFMRLDSQVRPVELRSVLKN